MFFFLTHCLSVEIITEMSALPKATRRRAHLHKIFNIAGAVTSPMHRPTRVLLVHSDRMVSTLQCDAKMTTRVKKKKTTKKKATETTKDAILK